MHVQHQTPLLPLLYMTDQQQRNHLLTSPNLWLCFLSFHPDMKSETQVVGTPRQADVTWLIFLPWDFPLLIQDVLRLETHALIPPETTGVLRRRSTPNLFIW